ncbi:MAG: radical SAM protein [Desulfomonile tiedjei]|nr:radical SAM protein [Desulfomonile tiedjei]
MEHDRIFLGARARETGPRRNRPSGLVACRRGISGLRFALVFPNVFRIGMGNLGFQVLYDYLNSRDGFTAERFFSPDPSTGKQVSGAVPRSEETGRPLNDFPVIAFSLPFENDYPAVPGMLLAAGIPPLERDRGASDPVVIAGGVSLSMNPEPLAPFLDLCFIGELEDAADSAAENFFSLLAELLSGDSGRGPDRRELQRRFRDIPAVYVPSAYRFDHAPDGTINAIVPESGFPEQVKAAKRLSKSGPVPVSVLFSPEAEFGDTLLVESNRGCGRGCRFCVASWVHFPVRYAKYGRFQPEMERALDEGRSVGLIGSDVAGHPELERILSDIVRRGGKFSLSSIRAEGLTPRIMELIVATGQKTVTLAPEVASPRLKRVIGKEIPNSTFYDLVEKVVAAGIPNLRFYFMVGLPTETEEDVEAVVAFVREARRIFVDASRPLGKIGRIGVQVNPFVPKPWTPFQWVGMCPARDLDIRLRIIQEGLKKEANTVVRVEPSRQAVFQGVVSRGDRRIEAALLRAARQEIPWSRIFKKGQTEARFYAHRERGPDEIFPWDVVDHGIRKETLWKSASTGLAKAREP